MVNLIHHYLNKILFELVHTELTHLISGFIAFGARNGAANIWFPPAMLELSNTLRSALSHQPDIPNSRGWFTKVNIERAWDQYLQRNPSTTVTAIQMWILREVFKVQGYLPYVWHFSQRCPQNVTFLFGWKSTPFPFKSNLMLLSLQSTPEHRNSSFIAVPQGRHGCRRAATLPHRERHNLCCIYNMRLSSWAWL